MLDNELNAILDEIDSGSASGISASESKFKTSDFSLDSILKEYGIIDDPKPAPAPAPAPKPQPPVKKEEHKIIKKAEPVIKQEEPKIIEPSKEIAKNEEIKIDIPKDLKPLNNNDEIKIDFDFSSIKKEIEEKKAAAKKEPVKEAPAIKPVVKESPKPVVEAPKPVVETPKPVVEAPKPVVEAPKEVEAPKVAPKVNVPTNEKKKVDIFDNQDIVSMLAANKLGKTNDKGQTEKKEITRLFSAEQEEDFKMRSGYIDIAAIKAATAAIKLDKTAENTPVEPLEMNTDQKILFGKIGSFFADTTFKYDTSTVNELTVTDKKKKSRNKKEDTEKEEVPEEIIPAEGDILEASDIPNVEQEMISQINISFLKSILTAILAIPLAILNLLPNLVEDLLPSLSMASPFNYATANLCILLIIAIININIVFKGVVSLFSLKPTGSTLASLSVIASLIHCVLVMLVPETITNMYGIVAALSVIFVLWGKYVRYRNIYKNFEILAFNSPKTACVDIAGGHSLKELYSENQKTVSCRPVTLLTHFLTNSFDYNFADRLANYSILGVIILAVLACGYAIITQTNLNIISIVSSCFALLSTFCFELSYSMPLNTTSNKIRKTGSAVVSYSIAKEYCDTTKFIMCDSDLFKPENITVHSMKINGNEKINDVIINCASLIKASNSPVSGAFLNILDNKQSMLMPVTDFDWTPGKGFSGNINDTKYFIGSSQFLADCGIKLPTIDLEEKYKRVGRQVVMFADSRKLLAVFSISYNRDEQIYKNLHKISLDNMKILVLTKDCNITEELLANVYEIDDNIFTMASKEEYERVYSDGSTEEKCQAKIYSITGSAGITSALANCKRLISTVKVSVIFRTIALIACLGLFVFAALTNNIPTLLTAKNIILFHLLWMVPSIFVSVFAG